MNARVELKEAERFFTQVEDDNAVAALRELDQIMLDTFKWLETQGLANESARLFDRLRKAGYGEK